MKVCMTVHVFGDYTRYIPYYIYSILKSYPNYYVKVYVNKALSANERKCLDLIQNQISTNFEVIERYLQQIDLDTPSKMVGGIGETIRFLLPYEELKDFDYAHIGDVDFLIIRERPTLLKGHLNHIHQIGVPYSNVIRPNSKRLSGLHFIKVKEYYQKMDSIIKQYLHDPQLLYRETKNVKSNEEFLYRIVEKGIGFGDIQKHHYRPPHGFHIGVGRNGNRDKKIKKIQRYLGQKQLLKQGIIKQLTAYYDDPLFRRIMVLSPDQCVDLVEEQVRNWQS